MADFAFLGNDSVSLSFLRNIYSAYKPLFVITGEDRQSGRGRKLTESPLAEFCRNENIELFKTASPNDADFMESLPGADFFLVFSFGYKLSSRFLELPARMCINIHPSLLPRYRGAAPVNRAVMNGETVSGVTFFNMTEKMDSGPIIMQQIIQIESGMTSEELMDISVKTAAEMFIGYDWESDFSTSEQDDSLATRAPKIGKDELLFNPSVSSADAVNRINGLSEYGVKAVFRGKSLKLRKARLCNSGKGKPGSIEIKNGSLIMYTSDGSIEILRLQPEGKQILEASQFINGYKPVNGEEICAAYSA